jgi:hypothetical protein
VRNGSVSPREEGFTKQTQVMLLGGWCAEDVGYPDVEIGVKLAPWLKRYSGKKMPQIYIEISYMRHGFLWVLKIHAYSGAALCKL